MSDKPTYKVQLSNGSTMLLRHLLNQPGPGKNMAEFIVSSQLLAEIIPEPIEQSERPHPITTPNYFDALSNWKGQEAAWSKGKTPEFTLTEKQRDVIKVYLKHAVEKQTAIPSKPAFDLFIAFGLTE